MKKLTLILTTFLFIAISACKESTTTAPVTPTYYMTAKIGSFNFDADNLTGSYKSATAVINGIDVSIPTTYNIAIGGLMPLAATYPITAPGGINPVYATLIKTTGTSTTTYNVKTGSLTVSKIDSVGATGTFSFTTDSTGVSVTDGKFNIKF